MILRNLIRNTIALVIAFFFIQCEKRADSEITLNPEKNQISQSIWVLIDEKGEPKIKNYQICKLVFLNENEYEVHRTFEYSGSTFRTPGIYNLEDSLIQLKTLSGAEHIGNVYLKGKNKLMVKWLDASFTYGEGTELYARKDVVNQ
jgi:hypothetical protein